jgi:hypothetical protein
VVRSQGIVRFGRVGRVQDFNKVKRNRVWQAVLVGLFVLTVFTTPVRADGGPIVKDPEVWVHLEEGTQVAVVRLGKEDTVQVNLFVSLLDASGESHEVTFFVPLGSHPSDFDVTEETSRDFQAAHTDELDEHLRDAVRWQQDYSAVVQASLLPGALLIQGMGGPLAVAGFILGSLTKAALGEGEGIASLATFQTEHSFIELYEIEADTNLEALIATAGLLPAVRETLRRLEGQQIAVVTMQTLGQGGAQTVGAGQGVSQQGLHLAWTSQLLPGKKGAAYAYPLGTGSAWARPIEFTSVYVVAPPGVDFRVEYPRLGENRSGYVHDKDRVRPHIFSYPDTPGHAVDQALGDFGRVWRVIYAQSNAAEDIIVTRVKGLLLETRLAFLRLAARSWIRRYTWAVGLMAGFIIWVTVWRFVMSRRLGFSYRWRGRRLWVHAISWTLAYWAFSIASLAIVYLHPLGGLLFLLALFGIVNIFSFALVARWAWRVPLGRAAGAYTLVAVTANVVYGLFALTYLILVGGL